MRNGREIRLADWALELIDKIAQVAARIDEGEGGDSYAESVRTMRELVEDSSSTPSARLLAELRESGDSFFEYAIGRARSHRDYFASITPMSAQRHDEFAQEAAASIDRQKTIEASDEITFEQYLANYYASE